MGLESKTFAVEYVLRNPAETAALGARIAASLSIGDTVALEGDLGAGKTTLARAILEALGLKETVPSPSFTLVQHYETPRLLVSHYDLYRIENAAEMDELGLDEALSEGAALIEWPERAGSRLPADALHVQLAVTGEESRKAFVWGPTRWAAHLSPG
jgi:tRNA threonylcarbamoyladenosine biosynthesis protein TsaE